MTSRVLEIAEHLARAAYPCCRLYVWDMYTNEGVGARRARSPLLEWCRDNRAECLAVQLPGRGTRLREEFLTSAVNAAAVLLPIVASKLIDTPYVVVGHSVVRLWGSRFGSSVCSSAPPLFSH